jgi:arginyl-tRNA synthetase
MTFRDLVDNVIDKAMTRLNEAELATDMDDQERADIARKVGVAALKYTELSNQPHMDYIFDIDQMTAFEGKTGPYLLYQAVRIKSLLRKAQDKNFDISSNLKIDEKDRALALLLSEFPDAVELAVRQYSPHFLCEYVFNLAQVFSSFYAACHIMSEDDQQVRGSRLKLCEMTHDVLERILALLGIQIPERM